MFIRNKLSHAVFCALAASSTATLLHAQSDGAAQDQDEEDSKEIPDSSSRPPRLMHWMPRMLQSPFRRLMIVPSTN